MNTANFDGKESPATGVNTTVGIPPTPSGKNNDSNENVDPSLSKVTGLDVVEKILDNCDIESFESKNYFIKNAANSSRLKQYIHNDAVVKKEFTGSVHDCVKQNELLENALVLDCQPVVEENIKKLCPGPSETGLESNDDCIKEMLLPIDAGVTVEEKSDLHLNQQLYSLDSMKIELSNVKNCLNEASLHDEEKDEDSESSDLEQSSGTTTTSTESDDEASYSSSTDSEEVVSKGIAVGMEEEDGVHQAPPKTRDEILFQELPAEPELDIKLDEETKLVEIGEVTSMVETLLVIKTVTQMPALDVDTVLFLENRNVLGKVFEIFGPVVSPYYAIRFNSEVEAKAKNVKHGEKVFYCPDMSTDITKFVFTAQLRKMKGSDASWKFDQEPPQELIEYSDDEEEKKAKTTKRHEKKSRNQGKKGHSDQAKMLGSHFPKQNKGVTQQSQQPSFQGLPPPQQQRPSYSEGFGHPSLRPGLYPRTLIPGGVLQPGHFSGPPKGSFIRTPQQIPRGGQFWPRPMQHCAPRGPAPRFSQGNPGFVVTAERPLGNRLPVSQQSPQLLRAAFNRPPSNLQGPSSPILHPDRCLLHGVSTPNQCHPQIRFPRPFGTFTRTPVLPQGTFEGVTVPNANPLNMINIGQQQENRAVLYIPPPPPPKNP